MRAKDESRAKIENENSSTDEIDDYDDSELWALRRICDAGGLSEHELSMILDWVSDSWKLSASGRSIISMPMPGDDEIL